MKKNAKWIILAVLLVALIVAAAVAYNALSEKYAGENISDSAQGDQSDPNADSGNEDTHAYALAPDFTVLDEDGNEVKLSDFRGKPVVLNFWATWCYYCEVEMPDFDKAYEKYSDVHFLMVNATDGRSDTVKSASKFKADGGYGFNIYFDTESSATDAYGVNSFPATYFIDEEGKLIARASGMLTLESLEQGIKMITEE